MPCECKECDCDFEYAIINPNSICRLCLDRHHNPQNTVEVKTLS